jgi:hypothetical protein
VEVDGLVNNIVGIVIDARLATEEITVKMPSPCVANWIEDKNRELTDPTDPLNFFDFPHLPYLRFFLAAAGLNTSWWPEKGSPYRFDPRYSFENFRSRCGDFKCPAALAAMSGGNPIELLFDLRYGIGVSKADSRAMQLAVCNVPLSRARRGFGFSLVGREERRNQPCLEAVPQTMEVNCYPNSKRQYSAPPCTECKWPEPTTKASTATRHKKPLLL